MPKTYEITISVMGGSTYTIKAETVEEAEDLAVKKAKADYAGLDIDIVDSTWKEIPAIQQI